MILDIEDLLSNKSHGALKVPILSYHLNRIDIPIYLAKRARGRYPLVVAVSFSNFFSNLHHPAPTSSKGKKKTNPLNTKQIT
jgi:hypothetical protein